MDNKKIKVSINLLGRNIPFSIQPEYEGIVREEVKRANRDYRELTEHYNFPTETDGIITFLLMELVEKAVLRFDSSQKEKQCKEAFETLKRELAE